MLKILLPMRARVCVFITLFALSHPQLWGQALTKQFPQSERQIDLVQAQQGDSADTRDIPVAEPVAEKSEGTEVTIRARTQVKRGSVYMLHGEVEIDYKDYVIRADDIRYDSATGEMKADGHLQIDGGPRDEHISATNGTLNVDRQTGRFYNVIGAIGGSPLKRNVVYGASNPFLFTGRVVEKNGPDEYVIHEGSMTSCNLPRPDWLLTAKRMQVEDTTASAKNVTFRLLNLPLFYLPYATHGTDVEERRTGFLIPTAGTSSTKGTIVGEAIYIKLGRSADLTVGSEYYSLRGFAETAEFRYKGRGLDGLRVRYNGLLDRGIERETAAGLVRVDQGGEDVVVTARRDFSDSTRAAADAEYLSSYVYRQAFTENFFIAAESEVKSVIFLTHEQNGVIESARFERYQSFQSVNQGDEIRILHLPSLNADVADHVWGNTRLAFGMEASAGGLSRAVPGATGASPIARVDVHPYVSLPLVFGGATLRPSIGIRETYYSAHSLANCCTTVQVSEGRNRNAFEAGVEARTPTLERIFGGAGDADQWKHTISGYAQYRYVSGVENFQQVLRFDPVDIVSDTNEIEYGLTQRLFRRSLRTHTCKADEVPEEPTSNQCRDRQATQWLSWHVAQKYFFDPTFGGAVVPGVRNVLATTLDFSAAAYLTAPRSVSPVLSELRIRAAEHLNLESDVEYDAKAGQVAASNVFAEYRRGDYSAGFGHSRLNAAGEPLTAGAVSSVARYDQLRFNLGYGNASKRGLSAAANGGVDLRLDTLQYGAVQTNYNWNCCGISIEYRRFSLGQTRNENQYRFNFTLAGVGTAGNLRRAERLF